MEVSKPLRAAPPTGESLAAEGPPRTRQPAVRVSPFQDAYTVQGAFGAAGRPRAPSAAIAGASAGAPVQAKR